MNRILISVVFIFSLSLLGFGGYAVYNQGLLSDPSKGSCTGVTMELSQCERTCTGDCTHFSDEDDGTTCYTCENGTAEGIEKEPEFESDTCSGGLMTEDECKWSCTGENICSFREWQSGKQCFQCRVPIVDRCPEGTSPDQEVCEASCPEDGTCTNRDGCFSCVVINCPENTFKNDCPESCKKG